MNIRNIQSNADKQLNGVWVPYPLGGEFLIARAGNERAEAALRKKRRGWKSRGSVPAEVERKWGQEIASEFILLDWRGLEDEDGSWDYTSERSFSIMSLPEWEDLALWVINQANEPGNYSNKVEENGGN